MTGPGAGPTSQRQVLVVDDTDVVRQAVVAMLNRLGYATRAAADGQEALDALATEVPDLVLCDLRMPRVDGLAFLSTVRDSHPNLPVVVMSGAGLFDDAVAALRLGAWDYVEKPIRGMAALEHVVSRALEKAELLDENQRYRAHLEDANRELRATLRLLSEDEHAGRLIQFRMLPRNHQRFGAFEFSRELVPSTFLSGDFIDAFAIDEHRWGFYLADVSGHGVSSALVTVILSTFFQRHVADFVRGRDALVLSPGRLLERLNEEVVRNDLDKHLTLFFGIVDSRANALLYANAGHFPWPLIFNGKETLAIAQPGVPIGLVPNSRYEEHRLQLPPQLVLAVFSDGLLEILPHRNLEEKLGFLRLLFGRPDVTVERVRNELGLNGEPRLPDDIAFLLIKRGDGHGGTFVGPSPLGKV